MSELEDEIKAKAKQLILDDGRNTITEDDMRRAADEILGPVDDENVDPDVTDA
jgi:histone H3/H4